MEASGNSSKISSPPTDDEAQILGPDQCICCKRSETQGTFFAARHGRYRAGKWKSWEARSHVFTAAADQGCRRCKFIVDAVNAYMRSMGLLKIHTIKVWGRDNYLSAMRATVCISLLSPEFSGERTLKVLHSAENSHDPATLSWDINTSPTLSEDPTCNQALVVARKWLRDCLQSHEQCRSSGISRMPKRVLVLSNTEVALRDTRRDGLFSDYACLSHCWGTKGPSIQLTSKSAVELEKGLHIDVLPKTFSQAAKVCLQLGIHYLWIDALCIYQDNPQDWKECASEMASVYENAQVTIAARSARNSDDGLRHLAKDRFRNILVPSTGLYVREYKSEFGYGHSVTEKFELWPLLSRAWVFQERHLSPRTLGFGPYQMLWQCRRSCHIEEERALLNRSYLQTEPANLVWAWHEVVQDYSQLQITYDSDRLPALAALATKMSEFRRDDIYLAGLWKHTLLRDLQWQTIHGTLQDRCNAHAPSWSWASVKNPVKFSTFFCLPSVELLNISYIPDGPPHMGRSTKASLTLKGKVGTIVSDESTSGGFELSISNPNEPKSYTSSLELLSFADYASNIDPTLQPPETFIVLFMASQMEAEYLFTSVSGLILRKTSTAAYERIACFFVSNKGEESSWDTYDAFSFEDESPPGEPADFFTYSETPLDKYMSTLPVKSVTIV